MVWHYWKYVCLLSSFNSLFFVRIKQTQYNILISDIKDWNMLRYLFGARLAVSICFLSLCYKLSYLTYGCSNIFTLLGAISLNHINLLCVNCVF